MGKATWLIRDAERRGLHSHVPLRRHLKEHGERGLRRLAGLIGCVLAIQCLAAGAGRDPQSGLYVIWYPQAEEEMYLGHPLVRGGQVVVQWGEVEPEPGRYDFSNIDERFADFDVRGQAATLQVNGNRKPQWLYDAVPVIPSKLSEQVGDPQGTLVYWYPAHREAYLGMVRALAAHLAGQPWKDHVLGVRLNFNAVGTEHFTVPEEYRNPESWRIPPGADRAALTPWTAAVGNDYREAVVRTYLDSFDGVAYVFVRNNVEEEAIAPYRADIDAGRIGWFHTSSEVEPRSGGGEFKYKRFYDDCRSGKTVAYAEPWASAWGHHGGKMDDRWCSPEQWNYWRLLFDLNCGVSFIAPYSNDFRVGIDGHYGKQVPPEARNNPARGASMQAEFTAAFVFAAKYAGWHAEPEHAPGAWIAFRENDTVLAANGMSAAHRKLEVFTSDYTFLMTRLPGDHSRGQGVTNVGPNARRYGAWARVLPAGETLRVQADARFGGSLEGGGAMLHLTYLDSGTGGIVVNEHRVELAGSGEWKTVSWPVTGEEASSVIEVRADGADATVHMVEITRGGK